MSNHVHLLLTPGEPGAVGAMLQDLGRRYVRVINTVHDRSGTLWEGRFRSSLVDSETYLLICHKYIELNPVRAGLVGDPADYAWSSHAHYAGLRVSPLISEHPVYLRIAESDAARRAAFRLLFATDLRAEVLTRIRSAVNSDSALGSEMFMERAEAMLGRSVRVPTRGRPPKIVTGKLL